MSEFDDQSLRNFVNSLGDTAVDLDPVSYSPLGGQTQKYDDTNDGVEKKKSIAIIAGIVSAVVVAAGVIFWFMTRDDASADYEKARSEYTQLREKALDMLADTELLAQECRVSIDTPSQCDALDLAMSDVEDKSVEIPETSPSREEVEKLHTATKALQRSLDKLEATSIRVEDLMGESIGLSLQEAIDEAEESSQSAHTLLTQTQGALEKASDADELTKLVKRLDSTLENAKSLLTDATSGTLASGTKPSQARDAAKSLNRLIDDIASESDHVRQSNQNYVNNQAQEAANNSSSSENTGNSAPSTPSPTPVTPDSNDSGNDSEGSDTTNPDPQPSRD